MYFYLPYDDGKGMDSSLIRQGSYKKYNVS